MALVTSRTPNDTNHICTTDGYPPSISYYKTRVAFNSSLNLWSRDRTICIIVVRTNSRYVDIVIASAFLRRNKFVFHMKSFFLTSRCLVLKTSIFTFSSFP